MKAEYRTLKYACYTVNLSMSVVANFPPLLFLTFRSMYGLSYSLLGFLVLVNYLTQLAVDLIFSFFSHQFNIPKVVKYTPVLTLAGLLIYALWPFFFPDWVYFGLLLGTVVFSASGGLVEVLISPVIAAIPSKDPDREMSKLHSVYAWGVVGVIGISTLFFLCFGARNWQWLTLLFLSIPLCSAILFYRSEIPTMETPQKVSGVLQFFRQKELYLCVGLIFFGGAAECTMAQWASGYLEQALHIPKVWGDIFGVALFAVMLGLGRSLYAKIGKHLERVLLLGMIGAALCYLTAAITPIPFVGLVACALTGFCTSMLWPGSLIVAAERFPHGGVFLYAMMASGGDFGASVGPQLIGWMTDTAMKHPYLLSLADTFGLFPEQLGMKFGMLTSALFPLCGIFVLLYFFRHRK